MSAANPSDSHAFVTGGTGFIGGHVVRELRQRGWRVTVMHRPGSRTRDLADAGVGLVTGDVTDAASVMQAMPEKVDAVFHLAASLNMWSRKNAGQDAINIDGTKHVVAAAIAKDAGIFINTSSISAYGRHPDPITEDTPSVAGTSRVNYERSKWLAEQEVRKGIARGLRAVIINPSAVLGPGDRTGWAQFFTLIKAGKVKGFPPGSLTLNDVRDVAKAHIAAVDKGENGANYLLGGETTSLQNLLCTMAELMHIELKAPLMPASILGIIGRMNALMAMLTGKPPELSPEMAELLCADIICGSDRAERELGYKPKPLKPCLEDSLRWLQEQGIV